MILRVANPIYDSVFKYLVEDLRIAKILISALLKKEVLEVEVRKHEYTNGTRDNISMFRIDFGAKVRESDGSQHLVLIELQKTWLETETLRFRQYLGAQYTFIYFESDGWDAASQAAYSYKWKEAIEEWMKLLETNNTLKRSCAEFNIATACYLLGDNELALKWLDRSDADYPVSLSSGLRKRINARMK